ncbi:TIGR00304 family membrane protein [[Eubacterium] cellulosolvens]
MASNLFNIGLFLILAGIFLIIILTIIMFHSAGAYGQVKGGGIIMIGPLPIIFGTDKGSVRNLIILALVLMVISILIFYLPSILVR